MPLKTYISVPIAVNGAIKHVRIPLEKAINKSLEEIDLDILAQQLDNFGNINKDSNFS